MKPRITVITITVDDLERSLRFYRDGLGLATEGIIGREFEHGAVAFFALQAGVKLAIWPRRSLSHDTGIPLNSPCPTEFTLEHNVASRAEVDAVMEQARKAGKRSWKTDEYRLVGIREYFGETEVGTITTSGLLEYREKRLKSGISELTTNRDRALLSVMFNFAIEKGLMSENPASKVRKFSEKDTARDRVLSLDEEKRLFAELPSDLQPIILAALHTGLRYRELVNLRWSDIDFERRTLKVEHTKSGKARFIPINAVLLGVCEKLKADHREGKLVFSLEPRTVRTGFENARKKAKLEDFTFHDLRRSFGTRLLELGVNIVTISRLYGHSNVLVTQNYLHPRDELSREAVDLLVPGALKPVENRENLAQNWHAEKTVPSSHPLKSVFSVN